MPGAAPPRVPTTALVVVRGPSFRAQLRGFLAADGHRIVVARSFGQALKIIVESVPPVDWLLIDASDTSTLALAADAIARNPTLKVLLISSEPEYAGRAAVDDVRVEFIEKPFAWRDLKLKIEKLLELRQRPERAEASSPEDRVASA